MKRWAVLIGAAVLVGVTVIVLGLTMGDGDGSNETSADESALKEPLGPEDECYIAVMNYLGQFPDALSQGYQGVDLRPLQTEFGIQSKTVQVARHFGIEITQKILLEGDPDGQLTAISPRVAADCGVRP